MSTAHRINLFLLWIVSIAGIFGIFLRIVNYDMRRDEQLYVPPAKLLENHNLYVDFFYNHTPGSAWIFRLFYLIVPGERLLFSARLAVFSVWLFAIAIVAFVAWRLTRSAPLTLFAAATIAFNDLFLSVAGMTATNNFLPLPFAFLGVALFLTALFRERPSSGLPSLLPGISDRSAILLSGLLLSIAASTKISAAAFIIPVVAIAAVFPFQDSFFERLKRGVFPLALGGLLGGLPFFIEIAHHPQTAFANILGFHTGPHIAFWQEQIASGEESVALTLGAKLLLAFRIWFTGTNLIALLIALALSVLWLERHAAAPYRAFLQNPAIPLAFIFLIVALFCFAPTPSFPQYFAAPPILLPLFLAFFHRGLAEAQKPDLDKVLVCAAILCLTVNTPRLAQNAATVFSPQKWEVNRVHRSGRALAAHIGGNQGKIATLLPIYPLEGGLPVYPELATGQFIYRIADRTDPALLRYYKTTSQTKIDALLKSDPPAAILVGFEAELVL